MACVNNITELVGETPMIRLQRFSKDLPALILLKMESLNPMSSIKDRIGLNMIRRAEDAGVLKPAGLIVEATSGNTGIALAYVGAARGYKVILTMPDTMSMERRKLLKALGAELVLTPGYEGMKGAVEKAEEILKSSPGAFMPGQFKNADNPQAHRDGTAQEIWEDCQGKIDIFVAGVGTGGSLTGIGEVLKEKNPEIQVVAVEPADSQVLAGGPPGPHKIQGIGAGFIPEVLNRDIIDEIIPVTSDQAANYCQRLARQEGILGGVSTGANLCAAVQLAQRPENAGKTIVTFACDSGERYLSTWLYNTQED